MLVAKMNYLEFPVTDFAVAKSFYGQAFGWTFTDYGDSYVEFSDGDNTGGFNLADSVDPGDTYIILLHQDLEGMQAQVQAAGGTLTRETFSFPGGERFEFKDPFGRQFAIWRPV